MTGNRRENRSPATESVATQGKGKPLYGFVILILLIVFVAYWMNHQSQLLADRANNSPVSMNLEIPGFRSDLYYLPDDDLLGFSEVPGGPFLMGSDPAVDRLAYENERWSEIQRQGSVDLEGFYLGKFEVTVAQFNAFLAANGKETDPVTHGANPRHPVVNITWAEALSYCKWLQDALLQNDATPSALKSLLLSGWSVSLPSEAQWEKAARGGTGQIFPWGFQVRQDRANFGATRTVEVGSISCPECSYGLSDMSGNVWEMTRSPYQPYPYNESDDNSDLAADALWVMRGGAFNDPEGNIRSAVRGAVDPGVRSNSIGFRIALVPPLVDRQ